MKKAVGVFFAILIIVITVLGMVNIIPSNIAIATLLTIWIFLRFIIPHYSSSTTRTNSTTDYEVDDYDADDYDEPDNSDIKEADQSKVNKNPRRSID